jgi:hypothetical protein
MGMRKKVRNMTKELILQMGTDKTIPRHVFHKPSQLGFLIEVNWKVILHLLRKEGSSGTQMGPRQMKVLELVCAAMAPSKSLVSA